MAFARTDIPALLDEVERLRNPGGDQLRTLTIAELSGDLNIMLFNEKTGLWDRCRVDDFRAEAAKDAEARATRAEAHAERLAGAGTLVGARLVAYSDARAHGDATDQAGQWRLLNEALTDLRQALSAYRGEMKTVLGEASR